MAEVAAVTGGRDFDDSGFVGKHLLDFHTQIGIAKLIVGRASGWDFHSERWAECMRIPIEAYEPDWEYLGHRDARIRERYDGTLYDANAGKRRNIRMLDEGKPKWLIAGPGGPGTAHMCREARSRGIPIWYCRP